MVRDADLEIVFANESLDEDLYSFATSKKKVCQSDHFQFKALTR